ncbi:MAG: hypothetical protein IKF80_09385, partial [Erysipelotrichaceae bacterium]|nr:hypothetical protein [Erysipelotrichaceae bacterium]
FCKLINGFDQSIEHSAYTERFIDSILGKYRRITAATPDDATIDILVRADAIEGNEMAEYIVMMHAVRDLSLLNVDNIEI